jgi:hypothetical protein
MTEIKRAVCVLTTALKNDPDFYRTYQANIAMAMFDELGESASIAPQDGITTAMHSICNKAAKRFLDMWINHSDDSPVKKDWFHEAF